MAKFYCKCCDYSTEYKQVFQRHLDCKRHKEQQRESIKDKGVDVYLLVEDMKRQNEILVKQNEILAEKIHKQDEKIHKMELKIAEKEAKYAEKEAKMNAKLVEMEAKYDKREHSMKQKFMHLEMKLMKQKPKIKITEQKQAPKKQEKPKPLPPKPIENVLRPWREKENNPTYKKLNDMTENLDNSNLETKQDILTTFCKTGSGFIDDKMLELVLEDYNENYKNVSMDYYKKKITPQKVADIIIELMKETSFLSNDPNKQTVFLKKDTITNKETPSYYSVYYYTNSRHTRFNHNDIIEEEQHFNCWASTSVSYFMDDVLTAISKNVIYTKYGSSDNNKAVLNFLDKVDEMKDMFVNREDISKYFYLELEELGYIKD
jgi:hypothetical protein